MNTSAHSAPHLFDPARLGQAVRTLRRCRHLGQAEFGAKVGMSAAAICNLEKGRHAPSLPTLCRVADGLGVTANELLYPRCYLDAEGGIAERAGAADRDAVREPAGAWPRAASDNDGRGTAYTRLGRRGIARVTQVAGEAAQLGPALLDEIECAIHDFLALEDLCGACKRAAIPLEVPFSSGTAGATHLAHTVRTHCGIGAAVVFDYIELLENHGLRVLFRSLPPAVESLSFHDRENGNAFLVLGDGFNPEKQLFRLAVELANIYLFTANRCEPVVQTQATRRFAKTFASRFLMPEEAVRATVMQLGVGPKDWSYELLLRIKHRFGVSAEACAHRLEEVGALDPDLRQTFKTRIHAHYDATGFSEPDSSRRVLSRNGRFGDLLLRAQHLDPAPEELAALAARAEGGGALVTPAFHEHP